MALQQKQKEEGNVFFQEWFRKAHQGDAASMFEVGRCYYYGYNGVLRDEGKVARVPSGLGAVRASQP